MNDLISRQEDLISREVALTHIDDVPYIKDHPNVGLLWKAWIENLPPAHPEKRTQERTGTHACDLISRAMLLEYIHNEPVGKMLCDKYNLDGVIKQLPSAQPEPSDAVYRLYKRAYEAGQRNAQPEIVRCKDCKHYQFADNRAFGMPVKMCEWFGFEDVDDDDFCSRAERRKK